MNAGVSRGFEPDLRLLRLVLGIRLWRRFRAYFGYFTRQIRSGRRRGGSLGLRELELRLRLSVVARERVGDPPNMTRA